MLFSGSYITSGFPYHLLVDGMDLIPYLCMYDKTGGRDLYMFMYILYSCLFFSHVELIKLIRRKSLGEDVRGGSQDGGVHGVVNVH